MTSWEPFYASDKPPAAPPPADHDAEVMYQPVRFRKRTTASVLFVMACLLATAYLLLAGNGQT